MAWRLSELSFFRVLFRIFNLYRSVCVNFIRTVAGLHGVGSHIYAGACGYYPLWIVFVKIKNVRKGVWNPQALLADGSSASGL